MAHINYRLDMGFYTGIIVWFRVNIKDPCPFDVPVTLTVAHKNMRCRTATIPLGVREYLKPEALSQVLKLVDRPPTLFCCPRVGCWGFKFFVSMVSLLVGCQGLILFLVSMVSTVLG